MKKVNYSKRIFILIFAAFFVGSFLFPIFNSFFQVSAQPSSGDTYSIVGKKFEDKNCNGIDNHEDLLSGWKITIEGPNQFSDFTFTDFGLYYFSNLYPGTYIVCEVPQGGWEQTYPNPAVNNGCYIIEITNSNASSINFGNCPITEQECTLDIDCDDGDVCTTNICDPQTYICHSTYNTNLCDDSFFCTVNDICDEGVCSGIPRDCSDAVDCTDDSCDEGTDQCVYTPDDTKCSADEWVDTGNTQWVSTDFCTEKEQKEQEYRDCYCDLVEGCTYNITDYRWVDTGGTRDKEDGTSCNDGNLCTENDVCSQGVCSGTPINCNDGIECTIDSCVDGVCQYDTSACSCAQDSDCEDGNICTDNTCNLETFLCESTYNTYQCNDNDLCTEDDVCSQGTCSGTAINCDDGDVCTDDSCNPETGCVCTSNTVQCDDNDSCTIDDVCLDGICSGTPTDCDDSIECTIDTCVDGVCQHDNSACPVPPQCGDGDLNEGEECDKGEELNGQECSPPCEQACTYCSSACQLITLEGESCGGGNGGGGGGSVITYYSPKLTIEKSIAETFANPGSTINYTIVVKNTGSAVAYNIVLTDTLPDGFTYTDTGLSTREWNLGNFGAGTEKTITYQVSVGENVVPDDYLNTAEVKANDLDPVSDDATIEIREGEVLGEATTTVPTTVPIILPKTGVPSSSIFLILFASFASLIFGTVELKKILIFER